MSSAMQSNPDQSLGLEQPTPVEPGETHVCSITPMIAKSQEAFCRDLAELLNSRYGWWVAYHGDERLGFGRTQTELYEECFRRGLTDDQFVVRCVMPDAADNPGELLTPWG